MIQRTLFLLTCLWLSGSPLHAENKPFVVGTASIFSDMAAVIGGNLIEVESIVPVGGDPHTHEPTPRDAKLAARADLILKNGLTFEGWLDELIENSGTNAQIALITEGIEAITSQTYKNASDPHAWMDPQNGLIYIKNIRDALVALDPEHEDIYDFNYRAYKAQLESLHQEIQAMMTQIPEAQRILITSHDAFQYFGRRYGIRLESVLGTSTDAEAQTSDILRLSKVIRESQVPAVFIESTVNPKLLEQIASDNNVKIGGKLFSDSIGDKDSEAPSYLDMLKYNSTTIYHALSAKPGEIAAEEDGKNGNATLIVWSFLAVLALGGLIFVIQKVAA